MSDPVMVTNPFDDDKLREECGIFGIFGHKDAAAHTALGLHALQHRGQEASGIVTFGNTHFHSQRGLGHIKDSLQLIRANRGVTVNIHDFANFRKDENIRKQVREANTIGCFYIESPAMRQLLKKLRCDDYVTLVAASSIMATICAP